jgi:hypothetical protein
MNPILKVADSIFEKLSSFDNYMDKYAHIKKNEEKFLKLYPVVAQHMCMGQYSQEALSHIIKLQQDKNIESAQIRDPDAELEAFFMIQAEYARQLAKPLKSKKECDKIYKTTLAELHENRVESEKAAKEYKKEILDIYKKDLFSFLIKKIENNKDATDF